MDRKVGEIPFISITHSDGEPPPGLNTVVNQSDLDKVLKKKEDVAVEKLKQVPAIQPPAKPTPSYENNLNDPAYVAQVEANRREMEERHNAMQAESDKKKK